ncbi:hypothetical protein AYI70_g1642 [Smittium culicis]|uniref:Uncharacterized protein n=1 Tax=Smittium culicis TaxID=133412 RepID=A0A1R1YC15_9FUNG|nr:hypothetical protein AYI70_g1642 [Smittium culicis]
MLKFDQNACDTIFSAGTPEVAAKVAPIARALGVGVFWRRSINLDRFFICLVILSTDRGLFLSLVFLKSAFIIKPLLFVCGVGHNSVATIDLYTV